MTLYPFIGDPTDVFFRRGRLDPKDHEAWRLGRVPCFERVIKGSLSRINFIMATLRRNSLRDGLGVSVTDYRTWRKRGGWALRFSKSGAPHLEAAHATHFVKKTGAGQMAENRGNHSRGRPDAGAGRQPQADEPAPRRPVAIAAKQGDEETPTFPPEVGRR